MQVRSHGGYIGIYIPPKISLPTLHGYWLFFSLCSAIILFVMGGDGDLQFGVPYRLPPRIAPGIHTVLLPNNGNHYFSPGRGAVRI